MCCLLRTSILSLTVPFLLSLASSFCYCELSIPSLSSKVGPVPSVILGVGSISRPVVKCFVGDLLMVGSFDGAIKFIGQTASPSTGSSI